MSEVTVRTLAKTVGTPVDKLMQQLAEAGMAFESADQAVSSTEKMKLLGFLRRTHGKETKQAEEAAPRQITLNRRKVEEISVTAGKTKTTVNVEVRQKRTYGKRDQFETPVSDERDDALRKLKESQARNEAEQAALLATDQRRADEEKGRRDAIEAQRKAAEPAQVVVEEAPVVEVALAAPGVVAPPAEKPVHKHAAATTEVRSETVQSGDGFRPWRFSSC